MTPERWERLKLIFHGVVALDPEARASYLAETCADDLLLKEEVESLLYAYTQVGSTGEKPTPGPLAPPYDPVLTVGHVLDDKYQIEAILGKGGMGVVYRARHIGLNSLRALKVMRRDLAADQGFLRRFINEARLAEGLHHGNLVSLYDFAQLADGSWYIVSEFVEGETIGSQLKRGVRFTPVEVADLIGQAADGLAYAHAKGIIHRDVSPENLMITKEPSAHLPLGVGPQRPIQEEPDGRRTVKVLDFGIAKAVSADLGATATTNTGLFMGKVGYASPEQIARLTSTDEPHDPRADVYSLAVVTYRMLTGKLPFAATGLPSYVYDAVIRPEEENQKQFEIDLPPAWVAPLSRALRRHREERTPSMEVFKTEIARAARSSELGGEDTVVIDRSGLPSIPLKKTDPFPKPVVTNAGPVVREAPSTEKPRRKAYAASIGLGVLALSGLGFLYLRPPSKPVPSIEQLPSRPNAQPDPTAHPQAALERPSGETQLPSSPAAPPKVNRPRVPAKEASTAAAPAPDRPSPTANVESVPPAPRRVGSLAIDSTPPSRVLLDDDPKGSVPLTLEVSPGAHRITLVTEDGLRWEKTVEVSAGDSLSFSPRLDAFGNLSVVSEVWANVSVDGGTSRQTPWVFQRLLAGSHRLRASRPGYKEQTLEVTVEEGKTITVVVKLEKLP